MGGVFDAERHASSIAISDETPETIFVHPPRRPLRDTSGVSQFNLPFAGRPPPSIPMQDNANSTSANNEFLTPTFDGKHLRHPNSMLSYRDNDDHNWKHDE